MATSTSRIACIGKASIRGRRSGRASGTLLARVRAARLLETFHRMMDAHRDKMELALTSADARRIVASGKTAVFLSIESGFDQEGDIDVLRLWHRLGVRFVQFAGQVTTA